MMIEITRADLHRLVWSYPLKEIAKFYGVNPVKLAEVCDAYDVARPPAGYWQKVAHGKSLDPLEFRSERFSADLIVAVKGSRRVQDEQVSYLPDRRSRRERRADGVMSGREMRQEEIPDFVTQVLSAGCSILAIGRDCYVLENLNGDSVCEFALEMVAKKFGNRDCVKYDIISYLQSIGMKINIGKVPAGKAGC